MSASDAGRIGRLVLPKACAEVLKKSENSKLAAFFNQKEQ